MGSRGLPQPPRTPSPDESRGLWEQGLHGARRAPAERPHAGRGRPGAFEQATGTGGRKLRLQEEPLSCFFWAVCPKILKIFNDLASFTNLAET